MEYPLVVMSTDPDLGTIYLDVTENGTSWNQTIEDADLKEDLSPFQLATLLVMGIVLGFIIVMTIGGNFLVLMAVIFNPSLRSATNCFIVNLALADLLLGISILPFSATLELLGKKWLFGQVFCNIWAATDVLCCTASINSLCVISVDRYIGVTRPLTYSSLVTHGKAIVACILVWVLSIAISVGPLLGWKEPPPKDPFVCEVNKQMGYVLFSVSFSFYIPTLIILIVYYKIYKAAARQTKFLETGVKVVKTSGAADTKELTLRVHGGTHHVVSSNSHNKKEKYETNTVKIPVLGLQGRLAKFRRQKKAAKTLGIVVGVFIICWFPFFFLLPFSTLCIKCNIPDLLFDVFFWTGYFNSCLNPIIYACSSRDFKRAFRHVLRCKGLTIHRGSRRDSRSISSKTIHFTFRSTRRVPLGKAKREQGTSSDNETGSKMSSRMSSLEERDCPPGTPPQLNGCDIIDSGNREALLPDEQ